MYIESSSIKYVPSSLAISSRSRLQSSPSSSSSSSSASSAAAAAVSLHEKKSHGRSHIPYNTCNTESLEFCTACFSTEIVEKSSQETSGGLNGGTPKSSILKGFSIVSHLGVPPWLWKPPCLPAYFPSPSDIHRGPLSQAASLTADVLRCRARPFGRQVYDVYKALQETRETSLKHFSKLDFIWWSWSHVAKLWGKTWLLFYPI